MTVFNFFAFWKQHMYNTVRVKVVEILFRSSANCNVYSYYLDNAVQDGTVRNAK